MSQGLLEGLIVFRRLCFSSLGFSVLYPNLKTPEMAKHVGCLLSVGCFTPYRIPVWRIIGLGNLLPSTSVIGCLYNWSSAWGHTVV